MRSTATGGCPAKSRGPSEKTPALSNYNQLAVHSAGALGLLITSRTLRQMASFITVLSWSCCPTSRGSLWTIYASRQQLGSLASYFLDGLPRHPQCVSFVN